MFIDDSSRQHVCITLVVDIIVCKGKIYKPSIKSI